MPSPIFRFREWLADRFAWAQYPRQQLLPRRERLPFFRAPMPWEARGLLILFGALAILAGLAALVAAALILFSVLSA